MTYGATTFWRLACLIAAFRIAALWLGWLSYSDPNSASAWGYFLLMLTLPDTYIAKAWRRDPLEWRFAGTIVLALQQSSVGGLAAAGFAMDPPPGALFRESAMRTFMRHEPQFAHHESPSEKLCTT